MVACLDQAPLRKTRRSATSIAPSTAHRVRRPVEETEVVEPTGPLKQAALLKAPVSVNQVPPVYQRSTSDDFVADSSLKDVFDKLFEEDDPALWVDYDSDNNKEWYNR